MAAFNTFKNNHSEHQLMSSAQSIHDKTVKQLQNSIMTDFKKSKANSTTETRDINELTEKTGNLYEAVAIMSKRAVQINKDIKEELLSKLEEFATPSESIEEIFENTEQIEVSKFYEKLPKGTLIAVQEFLEDNIYHRNTKEDNESSI